MACWRASALSLDKVEQRQTATLTNLEEGIDPRRAACVACSPISASMLRKTRRRRVATGGPFVPIKPPQAGASAFERQLYRINARARRRSTVTATR